MSWRWESRRSFCLIARFILWRNSHANFYCSRSLKIFSMCFSVHFCLYRNLPHKIPRDLPGSVLMPSIGVFPLTTQLWVRRKHPSPPIEMTSDLSAVFSTVRSFSCMIVRLSTLFLITFSKTPLALKCVSLASTL